MKTNTLEFSLVALKAFNEKYQDDDRIVHYKVEVRNGKPWDNGTEDPSGVFVQVCTTHGQFIGYFVTEKMAHVKRGHTGLLTHIFQQIEKEIV